jgi:hypothetical protein
MRPADRRPARPGLGISPSVVVAQLRERAAASGLSRLVHTETYRAALIDVLCSTHLDAPLVAVVVICAERGTYLHNRRGWTAEEAAAEGRRIVDQWGDL